uniref:kynurenine/alpha-aminoadipate aminotransferase, mitochondrial-like n=1 Tax=Styela clava TaxID=7725 RepID=UPI00193A7F39|nr:kynurenine/alpha-aminoadipate aminotransferase, mitochondrial-like [Styela clava]
MTTPQKLDFDRFFSEVSKRRRPCAIRQSVATLAKSSPTNISFGPGMPNPSTFPFESIDVKIKNGSTVKIEGEELARALQYSKSGGIEELKEWLRKIQKHYHEPPLMNKHSEVEFDLYVSVGSQDGLAQTLDMLLSPGDNILIDDPVFSGTLGFLKPLPIHLIPVETDEFGMKACRLKEIMQTWNIEQESKRPKVIYTIPNCSNPTGATASAERKKEIYKIAQEYDLVIVEDDPYYFLQYGDDIASSYQALDTDGRVLRSDSMSKVLSAGIRLGWVSGAKPFIQKLILNQEVTTQHNSTLIQMIVLKLLEQWKFVGFQNHLTDIKKFYKSQRDAIISSANKWLTGLAEWNVPEGGMFLWLKLFGIDDTKELVQRGIIEKEIVMIPGSAFNVEDNTKSSFCRLSFSLISPENIEEGIQRLSNLVREELHNNNK